MRSFACSLAASAMADQLSLENRIALAELMRDCADYCEPEIITG